MEFIKITSNAQQPYHFASTSILQPNSEQFDEVHLDQSFSNFLLQVPVVTKINFLSPLNKLIEY